MSHLSISKTMFIKDLSVYIVDYDFNDMIFSPRLQHWRTSLPRKCANASSTSSAAPALATRSTTCALSSITRSRPSVGIPASISICWKSRRGNWTIRSMSGATHRDEGRHYVPHPPVCNRRRNSDETLALIRSESLRSRMLTLWCG